MIMLFQILLVLFGCCTSSLIQLFAFLLGICPWLYVSLIGIYLDMKVHAPTGLVRTRAIRVFRHVGLKTTSRYPFPASQVLVDTKPDSVLISATNEVPARRISLLLTDSNLQINVINYHIPIDLEGSCR